MNESTHEGIFSQHLQTNSEQFKLAVTILNAYIAIFNKQTEIANSFPFQCLKVLNST